jgi:hypothetical protein
VLLIQTDELGCLGIADSVSFEDGRIDCQPGVRARVSAQWTLAQTRALHLTGLTFVGHIEATEDRERRQPNRSDQRPAVCLAACAGASRHELRQQEQEQEPAGQEQPPEESVRHPCLRASVPARLICDPSIRSGAAAHPPFPVFRRRSSPMRARPHPARAAPERRFRRPTDP